eukprot:CAMPEP_0183592670 /NCGR_PEP_ID=MMETSP0371-20130417/168373_1 /TAXON_ID=268820 /ORGANISM="Peridinium aciculiferum, Strain PAER-2" /LENGTH=169 /DNA_ID=CAMNT_0025804219 /DNA_START=151 /DNA_END=660 /DNA_ORIENTATION=-
MTTEKCKRCAAPAKLPQALQRLFEVRALHHPPGLHAPGKLRHALRRHTSVSLSVRPVEHRKQVTTQQPPVVVRHPTASSGGNSWHARQPLQDWHPSSATGCSARHAIASMQPTKQGCFHLRLKIWHSKRLPHNLLSSNRAADVPPESPHSEADASVRCITPKHPKSLTM